MKNKNYKYIVGLIIGMFLVTGVYGASSILASNVVYDSTNSSYSTGDIQGAIDDLAERIDIVKPTSCPSNTYCESYKDTLALGDYVSYTPTVKSYSVDTSITGYTGNESQVIYPSELNLWRVLNINDDGTVELISEYVSSTDVYFQGAKGYLNFVGYLNDLAEQYETDGITSGSRYFGYNGQTEYIEDTNPTSIFTNPAPWTNSTTSDDPPPESQGGGDTLYTIDYEQVNTALGKLSAKKVGTTFVSDYWIASRQYGYWSDSDYAWTIDFITGATHSGFLVYFYSGSDFFEGEGTFAALRPIVILKSGFEYGEGAGTKTSPMKIITS